jgi:hypothetical protein
MSGSRPATKEAKHDCERPSEWRKRRWLRKLQGIKPLSGNKGQGGVAVVGTTPLKPPNWFAPDRVPAAQSKSEEYLPRMYSSKGEWLAFFRFLPVSTVAPHERRFRPAMASSGTLHTIMLIYLSTPPEEIFCWAGTILRV